MEKAICIINLQNTNSSSIYIVNMIYFDLNVKLIIL